MGLCVFVRGGGGVVGMGLCVFVRGGHLPSIVYGNVLWGMGTIIFHFTLIKCIEV